MWGRYKRPESDDEVVGQADPANREQIEARGFTYLGPATHPARSPSPYFRDPSLEAAYTTLGRTPPDAVAVDNSAVVKQAMEVAMRKLTGTWTEEEQEAADRQYKEGRLLPRESAEMLRGDPLAGQTALLEAENGNGNGANAQPGPTAPAPGAPGSDGSGVPQQRPPA